MKLNKLVALVMAVLTACVLFVACGGAKVDGTYTVALDSNTYFAAQEVKNDLDSTDKRPDGSDAQVPFSRLFGMLDGRVAEGTAVANYYTATLTLNGVDAKSVSIFALDESGARKGELSVKSTADGARFEIGPESETIWYEVVIK